MDQHDMWALLIVGMFTILPILVLKVIEFRGEQPGSCSKPDPHPLMDV